MPRRLAQQRMALNDLEWPFQASRAISAVGELLVLLCDSYVSIYYHHLSVCVSVTL